MIPIPFMDRMLRYASICFVPMFLFLVQMINGQTDKGVIAVEAENAITCQGWRMVDGLSGKAMQDDSERGEGWLYYELEFDKAGRYFVYLLCMAPKKNTSQNDCYIYLENQRLYALGDSRLRPDGIRVHTDEFSWSGLPKGPGAHTPEAIRDNQVYFEIQDPGIYTLRIISRSMRFKLDKIVLQPENLPVPEGTGPAEIGLAYDPPFRIGKWDRFEASLNGGIKYEDPYRDVSLQASFFSPAGRMIETKGFYNGDHEWKVRFMPDEIGIWEYEIISSDSIMRQSGKFECLASDIPGMISVYENNPIWFGLKGGKPHLVRSLHIGDRFFADRDNDMTGEVWSDSLRMNFLDWFQSQGYNMLSIASHYLNRQQEKRGLGWHTPDLWNVQTQQPDPEEYKRMEIILDELLQRKIMVYPFAGFFGRGSDFPTDVAARDTYIEYTVARLGCYSNLLFMVGGPEPLLRKHPYLTRQEIDHIARKIKAEDVYGHLLSVHNYPGDDLFIDYLWNDYGILQGPKTNDREKLSTTILKNHHPGRPLYLQETLWPGNTIGHPPYSLEDIRKNALVMMLAGGAINFGDMNGNSSSGFSGTIDFSEKVQERHDAIHEVWDFFESLPYFEMKPRQDLVSTGYCLAKEGKRYLVYLDGAQILDIQLIPGIYIGKWINVEDLKKVIHIKEINHTTRLSPPDKTGDWLLYIWRN